MNNIGSSLDTQLRSRAQNLHANSTQLDKQQKDLVRATEGLRKETEKLKKVADEGARRVKELGNVQNWAELLERDFVVLEETLRLAAKGSGSEGSWESGSESGSEGSITDDEERLRGIGIFGQRMGDWVEEGDGSSVGEENRVVDEEGDTNMSDPGVEDLKSEPAERQGGTKPPVVGRGENMTNAETVSEEKEPQRLDKGKGKAVELETSSIPVGERIESHSGSSTTTGMTVSVSDPSSGSVHTAASTAS